MHQLQLSFAAAFGRLCVETFTASVMCSARTSQPPSGGCVLKLSQMIAPDVLNLQPPSGGCVLKQIRVQLNWRHLQQPPSGGCVLKHRCLHPVRLFVVSRLRAAVC